MHRDGSSVIFPLGSQGVSGLATSDPLTQMTQLALILFQLPSRQLTCTSTQGEKKMTTEMALYIIYIIVIFVRNGISDLSSNLGQDYVYFLLYLRHWERDEFICSLSSERQIVVQTGFFSFG